MTFSLEAGPRRTPPPVARAGSYIYSYEFITYEYTVGYNV